ncbi:hypothetical protein LPB68_17265 [Paenibacillus crassostreae]|nr:hypothetical protein LPB68_17265 [Paenibacillus crassostreae]
MSFSKLKIHNLDIYLDYTEPFKQKVNEYGYDELFSPFTTNVSYPIAALNPAYEVIEKHGIHNTNYAPIPSDTKEVVLTKIDVKDFKKIIDLTLDSLERALNFVDKNELREYITRMDYILYLTGFFSFQQAHETTNELEVLLVSWVKTVNFTNQSNSSRREVFSSLLDLTS